MGEVLNTVILILTALGLIALAYKNYKDGKAAGLTPGHRTSEINLSAFEKINQAQAHALALAEGKVEKFEGRISDLEKDVKLLKEREEVWETRELMLAGALTHASIALPKLPALPTE